VKNNTLHLIMPAFSEA